MGDSGKSRLKEVPSWQLSDVSDPSKASGPHQNQSSEDQIPDPRASLVQKASKFLDDPEIQGAPKERKIYFLHAKGLTDQEIEDLLAKEKHVAQVEKEKGAETANEASTTPNNTAASAQQADIDITDDYIDSEPVPPQKQDGPPIITYPEFLLHSQKPPPLITTGRLLTAFYLTSGAAATMYGLSNYLIEPMVESLSSARHSFFQGASTNIGKLNEKLEGTVSEIPDVVHGHDDLDGSDLDSASSDPARFFSRTIATQTSPHLSRSSSSISLSEKKTSPSAVVTHASHMSRIHELLSDLKDADSGASNPVRDNVGALRDYLHNLPSGGRTGSTGGSVAIKNDDGVAKVKAEIKSVKGTLLSARNFPAGTTSR